MALNVFTPKRGMVFYLEEPFKTQPIPLSSEFGKVKTRPWIVISNDVRNERSKRILMAPCTTKAPEREKCYLVPFRKNGVSGPTYNWVDVDQICCIDKSLCNQSTFSESISKYTYGNEEFLNRLADACAIQVGYRATTVQEVTIKKEEPTLKLPEINITINIPGLEPVKTKVEEQTVELETDVEPKVTIEEKTLNKLEQYYSNKVNKELPEKKEEETPVHTRRVITKDERDALKEKIFMQSRLFKGTKTIEELPELLGISHSTVSRIIAEMRAVNYKNCKNLTAQKRKSKCKNTKWLIPRDKREDFLKDFSNAKTPKQIEDLEHKYKASYKILKKAFTVRTNYDFQKLVKEI